MVMPLNMFGISIQLIDVYGVQYVQAYFEGQGSRYYVQHCATLGDIGNFQRKVVCVAGRIWGN
jgi:hypothetical protein